MTGILFDYNGTMFPDGQLQDDAWRQYILEKTGHVATEDELRRHMNGHSVEYILTYFWGKTFTREEAVVMEEEKEIIYRKMCMESPIFHLADGLPALLDTLQAKDVPMTIATGCGLPNLKFYFRYMGLGKWFRIEDCVYNDGVIPGKPAPDMFLRSAEKLGLNPRDCVVFEDSISGIEAAKAAGVKAVFRLGDTDPRDGISTFRDFTDAETLLKLCGIE